MAEVVGLVASITGIIQVAGQVIGVSCGYIGSVGEASQNIGKLAGELSDLNQVLIIMLGQVQGNSGQPTALPSDRLLKCQEELRKLLDKLKLKQEPKSKIKKVMTSLKWPLEEADTLRWISWVERQKSFFNLALTAESHAQLKAIQQGVEKAVVSTQDTQASLKTWQQQEDFRLKEERRRRVLDWVFSDDFNVRHNEIKNVRQEGTGEWFPRRPEFKKWSQGETCRLLWGRGIPGAGKTFLSSIAIDHFESQALVTGYGVAHVYFNYKEQESQKPIQVLSSLVRQLANRIPTLPKKIGELHDEFEKSSTRPTIEQLYTALVEMSKLFTQVFFVFDALDECHPETQRKGLLPLFNRMGNDGIYVLLTSRPHPQDIGDSLCDAVQIGISAQEEDITIYIRHKIRENPRTKDLIERGKCEEKIISGLVGCAEGMFLLVRFHIEYLCQQITPKAILKTLDNLKSSGAVLNLAYERAVASIHSQPENTRNLALKVLSWLSKARRTLTIKELQTAVAVEPERYELDELDLAAPETLIDVCASLVTIDGGTIRLAHYTVQEYLLGEGVLPATADFDIAMACTTYLSFHTLAQGPCTSMEAMNDRLKSHPLLSYAAQQLNVHLKAHLKACDEDLSAVMYLHFIQNPRSVSSWHQCLSYKSWGRSSLDEHLSGHLRHPLHIASDLGHFAATRLLLEGKVDNLAKDNHKGMALSHAVKRGHNAVVGLLLNKGIDIAAQDWRGYTALHHAAVKGHETIVGLLLDKGANVTAQDSDGCTALHRAVGSKEGHEATVMLLLDKGVDITARDGKGRTALHHAAETENRGIVGLLLDKGADITAQDSDGCTALHRAVGSKEGHEATVRLLLDKGADITARDGKGRTALHHAAETKNRGIVGLLLDKGANVTAQDSDGCTALHRAVGSKGGHEAAVMLLLDKGADITARDGKGRTALHHAAETKNRGIVGLLLDKGADITAQDSDGCTALHRAVGSKEGQEGHEATVRLLLDKGADITARDGKRRTVLHHAVLHYTVLHHAVLHHAVFHRLERKLFEFFNKLSTIKLLLDKKADITAQDSDGYAALHHAVMGGHEDIVMLLLDKGADITARDGKGRTALHHAVETNIRGIIELLLDKGADITAQDSDGCTALHRAVGSKGGHEATVKLLLDKGADITARDGKGHAVLHHAVLHHAVLHHAVARRRNTLTLFGNLWTIRLLLLNKRADITVQDSDGYTALHHAVMKGHEDIVMLLLDKGADITARDGKGRTALHHAVETENRGMIELLLDKRADTGAKDGRGCTVLQCAAMGGNEIIFMLLLEKGGDIATQGSEGQTMLHYAVAGGYEVISRLLLDRGVDIKARVKGGDVALLGAVAEGSYAVVKPLLDKGADIEAQDHHDNRALVAAQGGRETVIKPSLDQGADISSRDKDGDTALHCAAAFKYSWGKYIITFLLDNGADPHVANNRGQTALDVASEQDNQDVVNLLLNMGCPSAQRKNESENSPLANANDDPELETSDSEAAIEIVAEVDRWDEDDSSPKSELLPTKPNPLTEQLLAVSEIPRRQQQEEDEPITQDNDKPKSSPPKVSSEDLRLQVPEEIVAAEISVETDTRDGSQPKPEPPLTTGLNIPPSSSPVEHLPVIPETPQQQKENEQLYSEKEGEAYPRQKVGVWKKCTRETVVQVFFMGFLGLLACFLYSYFFYGSIYFREMV